MRRILLGAAIVVLLVCANSAFACSACAWLFEYQAGGEGDWCYTCDYDVDCGVELCNIVQVSGWDACETAGNGCFTVHRHCPFEPQVRLAPPAGEEKAKLAHMRVTHPKPRRRES